MGTLCWIVQMTPWNYTGALILEEGEKEVRMMLCQRTLPAVSSAEDGGKCPKEYGEPIKGGKVKETYIP